MTPVRILHLHSSFSLGGKEARAVRLMNAFGDAARHSIVSGVPGQIGARRAIAEGVAFDFPDFPSLTGRPGLTRYRAMAAAMRPYDLVLTYNWGAIDAVMARRLHGGPPLVHHEDGFNDDEAKRQKPARVLWRRLALPAAHALAVPSGTLERIALGSWGQSRGRVRRIVNGIDLNVAAQGGPLKGVPRIDGEIAIVTIAGLRKVKDLTALVFQLAQLNEQMPARLTILGEGPERGVIAQAAHEQGVESRVHLVGFVADPARFLGQFDIFALTSLSEQFPISVVEAMAAGLPVVSTDVGDVRAMVATENQPFVAAKAYEYHRALVHLAADPAARASIGAANRGKALALYDEAIMIDAYRALYAEAIGRPGALG